MFHEKKHGTSPFFMKQPWKITIVHEKTMENHNFSWKKHGTSPCFMKQPWKITMFHENIWKQHGKSTFFMKKTWKSASFMKLPWKDPPFCVGKLTISMAISVEIILIWCNPLRMNMDHQYGLVRILRWFMIDYHDMVNYNKWCDDYANQ